MKRRLSISKSRRKKEIIVKKYSEPDSDQLVKLVRYIVVGRLPCLALLFSQTSTCASNRCCVDCA
jgi:hypothetical protein